MQQIENPKYMFLRILETWFLEPIQMIQASLAYPLGWKKKFNFYNLNPEHITREQAEKRPILLLHGNYHNQSAWLSLASSLAETNLGPVYTVNLFRGNISEKDCKIIDAKIEEIKNQYRLHDKGHIQVDLVGHSRGAKIAYYMGIEQGAWRIENGQIELKTQELALRTDIRKIIRLGYPTAEWDVKNFEILKKVFDIAGKRDVIVTHKTHLLPGHHLEMDCGHMGLLYDPQVHEQVIKWLSD